MSGLDIEGFKSIAERFIEKASKMFEDAAIVLHAGKEYMAKYANSVITVVQSWSRIRAELFLARGQKIYHSSISVSSIEQLERMLEVADKSIERLDKLPFYASLPEPTGRPLEGLCDKRVAEKLEGVGYYADLIIEEARNRAKDSKTAGMLEADHIARIVATSKGALLAEEHTRVTGYARVIVGDASGHWAWTGRSFEEEQIKRIGSTAADYAIQASKARRVKLEPGEYTAILSPLVVGNLIDMLGFMASGLAVLMGYSFLAKYKPGDKVASEKLTIVDDPGEKTLPFSTGFDDEGVATFRKPIIEKGVYKTLLHNTRTAKALGASTTGNAGLLMPHPWNIVIAEGDSSLDEMIAETRRGLLVNNNWYTRFQNYYEGVFSTVTRDALLYIEGGEVRGRIDRLRIADVMTRLLSSVTMVSKERFNIQWWEVDIPVLAPYILAEKVRFTRPEA